MRWLAALVVALFTVLAASTAFAQGVPQPPSTKPNATDEAAAKKAFESGLKLYGESAYSEALVAFETSYRLGGRFTALKNVAQCHRNLKHFVDAHEAYEQLLSLHGAQLPAADKKSVEQALEELSVLTGTILVNVNEADANIDVDGKTVGKSPMTKPKRTSVGTHRIRITKSGFDPNEQDVNVGSQEQKKVDVTLSPEKTSARISVREQSGRDVHVFIDNEDKGPAPWEGDVPAGEHTVEAKGPRFAAEPRKIKVAPKERLDIAFDASATMGRLRITTIPATASINVDGRTVGTGAWEGELPEGTHKILVTLAGQPEQSREITLGRGQLIVQEIPVAVGAVASVQEYRGLYGRFNLQFGLAVAGLPDNSVSGTTVQENNQFAITPAGSLRIGHSYGWLAAEAVGVFFFEHRQEEVRRADNVGSGHRYESNAFNWFLGVGPRVTSKTDVVRFTFGLTPGLMFRNYGIDVRNQQEGGPNPDSFKSNNGSIGKTDDSLPLAGYTTFGLVADGGVLFGSTPGAKFFLGAQAMIDFPPDDIIVGPDPIVQLPDTAYKAPNRGILVTSGTQITVGPTLGVQFGH